MTYYIGIYGRRCLMLVNISLRGLGELSPKRSFMVSLTQHYELQNNS